MNKKFLVISIVIIIAIILCLTAFFMVNSHEESLSTLRISNSCTIEVPMTNNTVKSLGNGVYKFIFEENNVNITHQKSGNNSEIKKINSDMIKNSKEVEDGIYYDSSTGNYFTFIENEETGDAILIEAKDLDLLKRIAKSVKFTKPKTIETNETDIEDDSSSEDTDYSEDEYTPDYDTPETPKDDSPKDSESEIVIKG